jgi:nicotinamide-nucleotide amidase
MTTKIRQIFENRGRTMTLNNLRQADIPVGAYPIPQMPGTAPGLVCPIGDKVIYAVPGVPSEMREMMSGTVIPDICRRSGQSAIILSRTLRTWGLSESGIDEMLTERMAELDRRGNPTIAFNASGIEGIKVRITAKCADVATARRLLDEEEREVRAVLGEAVFGIDDQSMEAVVLEQLRRRSLTIAAAETLTGGILSSRMSALDPVLATFRGSTIAPEQGGDSAEQRATFAAQAVRRGFDAAVGIAASPPAPELGEPPGTVYLAMANGTGAADTARVILPGDRRRMREYAVISLLNFVRQKLDEQPR